MDEAMKALHRFAEENKCTTIWGTSEGGRSDKRIGAIMKHYGFESALMFRKDIS